MTNAMSLKRKHPHDEVAADASACTPVKKIKLKLILKSPAEGTLNSAQKRKYFADEIQADDAALRTPAKKLKTCPGIPAALTTKPATRRYNTPTTGKPKSPLVPRGERRTAKLGHRDESVLRMVCDSSVSDRVTELHFRKIPHSEIDWNSAQHIRKINAWRNQIYGRAGLKARSVSMWHEMEELWFELYFHLSIAESRQHGIMLPVTKAVRKAFNDTFVGKVLQDKDGNDLDIRTERQPNAFASKFGRVCPLLRARLDTCVFGKSGDVFIPKITFEMINKYKAVKVGMKAKGIKEESVYSNDLPNRQHLLSHLPGIKDVEIQDLNEEKEDKMMQAKEENAAAALLSLASSPVLRTTYTSF